MTLDQAYQLHLLGIVPIDETENYVIIGFWDNPYQHIAIEKKEFDSDDIIEVIRNFLTLKGLYNISQSYATT